MTSRRQSDRGFAWMMAGVFLALEAIVWAIIREFLIWPVVVSGLFAAAALTAPHLLMPLNRLWAALARSLAWVNNRIVLGFAFFVFVFPFGAVCRVLGRDPMARRMDPNTETYFTAVKRQAREDTLGDMF